MKIRRAAAGDVDAIQQLFVASIQACTKDYKPDQLGAWVAAGQDKQRWLDKINHDFFLTAWSLNKLIGFGSLATLSCIDLLYVHPDHQRKGVGYNILSALEAEYRKYNFPALKTYASIPASPFFIKMGFEILHEKINLVGGIEIKNYSMEKHSDAFAD